MTVYFVSDIHLTPKRPDLSRAFSHLLQQNLQDATQLYLLGDIFDAWIGDDSPTPQQESVFNALRALSAKGCEIFFQHGNRDFLVGEAFANSINAQLLPEVTSIDLPLGKAVISHGDQLCTDDAEYMQFRAMTRNPQWQQTLLHKPVAERLSIAQQLRETSQQRTAAKAEYITDVNPHAVLELFAQTGVNLMIHGHTHRPQVHHLTDQDKPLTRIVLGDWDESGWYLKVNAQGYELIQFPIAPI